MKAGDHTIPKPVSPPWTPTAGNAQVQTHFHSIADRFRWNKSLNQNINGLTGIHVAPAQTPRSRAMQNWAKKASGCKKNPELLTVTSKDFPTQPIAASASPSTLGDSFPFVLIPNASTKPTRLAWHQSASRMEILISCYLRCPTWEPVNEEKGNCSSHAAPGLHQKASPGLAQSDSGSSPVPSAESFHSAWNCI